jgi:hypothetical protein
MNFPMKNLDENPCHDTGEHGTVQSPVRYSVRFTEATSIDKSDGIINSPWVWAVYRLMPSIKGFRSFFITLPELVVKYNTTRYPPGATFIPLELVQFQ